MNLGFIRAAAATPDIKVADTVFNRESICKAVVQGQEKGAKIMVFPELCLTGYTCGDLFLQKTLQRKAKEELVNLVAFSIGIDMIFFVGLPWEFNGKLYNVAAAIKDGVLLGLIPKTNLPNYSEFYELRQFNVGNQIVEMVSFKDADFKTYDVPMGTNLLFRCDSIPDLVIGAEICEDVWAPNPPSIHHCLAGATIIVNCSASDETTGKDTYRESLICGQSARLVCGYIYANAGEGESTQDLVFGGHNIIAENGTRLAVSKRFINGIIYGDMDLERLASERRRMTTYGPMDAKGYTVVSFSFDAAPVTIHRYIDPAPFVPKNNRERKKRCEEIMSIQAMGLKKRLEHTGCRHVVIGISGGLDSTLALLVAVRAFDLLDIPRDYIHAITMPCFGTTDRTYNNACLLSKKLGASLMEVDIKESVLKHFSDIGQDADTHDITFENAQARERTQVLMDLGNKLGGMVIGTGDMSELALGWATYNGDHMSMYGVNASVPKTLVRHLVQYYADSCAEAELNAVLMDVLDTPVSPELLPPQNGKISQETEDFVGPYELHDFFLYYMLRFGYEPKKIYTMALMAWGAEYSNQEILKWLTVFYRRFFTQQFKRSCLPDGPKVGSVAVSPRGDLRMPSDASGRIWLEELESIAASHESYL